ncbi:hypothetical protein OG884_36455 [Streptosporangium sp. NBC_01755]|nr:MULTISPECIES: hypothetical protein [unclassified Streptosporangium]WSA28323.1 hypothetical protein OIE13_10875 [Streptosporangium sp. NBC_01810]WSD00199.1 hypothetical protein OG884_36455 [Streptosporangium sp. NBC_01755]
MIRSRWVDLLLVWPAVLPLAVWAALRATSPPGRSWAGSPSPA